MIKLILRLGFKLGFALILFILGLNLYVKKITESLIFSKVNSISNSYTGLVLGAKVYENGDLSGILKDRVDAAIELYENKKIKRFLLSGDHGRENYDEVNHMKKYLLNKGVPIEDIFLDHAGFDTYNSIYRAKKIFKVDSVIIISQAFHVKRAVYIAKYLDLQAQGYTADKHTYGIAKKMIIRESLANVKAFFELLFNREPKYLGAEIDIQGDSSKSFD